MWVNFEHLAYAPILVLGLLAPGLTVAQTPPGQQTGYVADSTALLADGTGASLGQITPATPVRLLHRNGDSVEISLQGWSVQGAKQYVFSAVDQRIVLAVLNASGQAARRAEGQQTDPYGSVWEKVEITGTIPAAELNPSQDAIWVSAKKIFVSHCAACHAIHNPDEFTANQWPSILKVMAKNAALNPADAALVTKYLQLHAKDSVVRSAAAEGPAIAGPSQKP